MGVVDVPGTVRLAFRIEAEKNLDGFAPVSAIRSRVKQAQIEFHMLAIIGREHRALRRFVEKICLGHNRSPRSFLSISRLFGIGKLDTRQKTWGIDRVGPVKTCNHKRDLMARRFSREQLHAFAMVARQEEDAMALNHWQDLIADGLLDVEPSSGSVRARRAACNCRAVISLADIALKGGWYANRPLIDAVPDEQKAPPGSIRAGPWPTYSALRRPLGRDQMRL